MDNHPQEEEEKKSDSGSQGDDKYFEPVLSTNADLLGLEDGEFVFRLGIKMNSRKILINFKSLTIYRPTPRREE